VRRAALAYLALVLPAAAAQSGGRADPLAHLRQAVDAGLCPVAAGMSAADLEHFAGACLSGPATTMAACEKAMRQRLPLQSPGGYRTPRLVRHEESMNESLVREGSEILKHASTTPVLPGVLGALPDLSDDLDLIVGSGVQGLLEDPFTIGTMLTPFEIEAWFFRLRGGAFFVPTPEIHPKIAQRLDATGRSRQRAEIESGLHYDDAVLLQAELSFRGRWLGRDALDNWADIGNVQASAFVAGDSQDPEDPKHLKDALDDLRRRTREDGADPGEALKTEQGRFAQVFVCFHEDEAAALRAASARIQRARLQDWGHLVNNQPQLFLRYRRTRVQPAIDAQAHSYSVHLATGLFNNLDWVRLQRDCNADLSSASTGKPCIDAFGKVADHWAVRYSPAVAAFFERGWFEPLEFDLAEVPGTAGTLLTPPTPPIPAETVTVAGSRYDRFGASLGIYIFPPRRRLGTVDSTRVDLSWDAYRFDSEVDRLGYQVVRVTTTRQVGDVSFTLTWMERGKAKYRNVVLDDAGLALGIGYGFGLAAAAD
jgi:hypothetical protein